MAGRRTTQDDDASSSRYRIFRRRRSVRRGTETAEAQARRVQGEADDFCRGSDDSDDGAEEEDRKRAGNGETIPPVNAKASRAAQAGPDLSSRFQREATATRASTQEHAVITINLIVRV
jgi:hypothetical protein